MAVNDVSDSVNVARGLPRLRENQGEGNLESFLRTGNLRWLVESHLNSCFFPLFAPKFGKVVGIYEKYFVFFFCGQLE